MILLTARSIGTVGTSIQVLWLCAISAQLSSAADCVYNDNTTLYHACDSAADDEMSNLVDYLAVYQASRIVIVRRVLFYHKTHMFHLATIPAT